MSNTRKGLRLETRNSDRERGARSAGSHVIRLPLQEESDPRGTSEPNKQRLCIMYGVI